MKHVEKVIDYKLMGISSSAFRDGGMILSKYTCEGDNINPPLDITGIPEDTKCLALIVDDPDAPKNVWVHWVVWNIPVTHHLKENHVMGKEGINDFQQHCYGGPCPPSGTHRYFFKVYALDDLIDLPADARKPDLEKAMSEHILGFGELIGLYRRNK